MAFVLVVSVNVVGARISAIVSGAGLALPCFVSSAPLPRTLLACSMAAPFIAAAAFVMVPPVPGIRSRLAYLMTWCGTRPLVRCKPHLDVAALGSLLLATVVLAVCIAGVKSAGELRILRWLAGGFAVLAFAEMATTTLPLVTRLFGVAVPQLMQSPHMARSVGDFWTKHWNIGASEIFRQRIFKPVSRFDTRAALIAVFAISGLAHAMLAQFALQRWGIALLCGAFFLVQPPLIGMERLLKIRRWPAIAAHAWTIAMLAAASPLFVEPSLQVVEPSWGPPGNVIQPALATLAALLCFSLLIAMLVLAAQPPLDAITPRQHAA